MIRARLSAGALLALLGGCATAGKDYAPPEQVAPPTYAARPAGMVETDVEVRWWRTFGDPGLDQLIARALAANLDAKLAIARLDEARALARAARAERLPGGGVNASYQRRRLADLERFGALPRDVDFLQVGAEADWELDLFGRIGRSIEAAQAEVGGASALLRDVRVSVAADVALRYFELRGAEAALRVARASVANQQRSLDVTRKLAALGGGARFDVVRAEAQLRAVEATVAPIEQRIAVARHALAVLLGETPEGFAPPPPDTSRTLPQVATVAVGSPADLLRRRPDIEAAERNLAAANARAGAARAELFPSVRLTGLIGLLAGNLGSLASGGAFSFAAGPSLDWGVFDLPRLRAQVRAADARTDAALVVYHRTVLDALREVEDALATYGAVRTRMERLAERAVASREAARLASIRFREGEGQFLDVLEAERARVDAESELVEARAQHLLSVVGIYRALGGGWEVCDRPGGFDCATTATIRAEP
jgi:multidrug efflux system outer membrane protein